MDLYPRACPKCGDQLSIPIRSRREGLMVQTCRNGACLQTVWTTVAHRDDATSSGAGNHSAMFALSTSASEPPRPRPGAMAQFNRAQMSGRLREAILGNRKKLAAANAIDPKLKQLEGRDR